MTARIQVINSAIFLTLNAKFRIQVKCDCDGVSSYWV